MEMLIHPGEWLLAVRPCSKDTKNAVRWAKHNDEQYLPRMFSCAAYIRTFCELFGWKSDCKYRIRGIRKQKDDETVLVFDLRETEMFIPSDILNPDDLESLSIGRNNSLVAYPTT